MKYTQFPPFLNHFREAASKQQLSSVYGLFGMSESERVFILRILSKIAFSQSEIRRFKAQEEDFFKALECLNSFSLFSKNEVVFFDGIDKLSKESLEACVQYCENPSRENFLFLGASSIKGLSEFIQRGKKEVVFLDLTSEKPWEKTDRVKHWVELIAKREQKVLQPEALTYLLENVDADIEAYEQSLEKVFCFLPQKKILEKKDLKELIPQKNSSITFQIAEGIIYGDVHKEIDLPKDSSSLILLIGAFRYQLQLGQKLSSLLERKASIEEIHACLPNLRSTQLDKLVLGINRVKKNFFIQGLCLLFDLEYKIKSTYSAPEELLKDFILKLEVSKKRYV